MSQDLIVRALDENEWQDYKTVRLAALKESPEAFVATLEEESAFDDAEWQDRMTRSLRIIAERDGRSIGVASVGRARLPRNTDDEDELGPVYDEDVPEHVAEVFGLWVEPISRGTGVSTELMKAAVRAAADKGDSHLVYWVGSSNARAVAFASGMGFRPAGARRPMGVADADESEDEVAMILPLGENIVGR